MRTAIQQLTTPAPLVASGGHHRDVTWWNYTTLTYTSEICLEIAARDAPGGTPRVRFSLMRHLCA